MPSETSILKLCVPVTFTVTIYIYDRIADFSRSFLLHAPPEKVFFFNDLIEASTKEEARQKAIRQFWEDMCHYYHPDLEDIPDRVRHLTELPEHFYIDAEPVYRHEFERKWKERFSSLETRYARRWGIIKKMILPRPAKTKR